MTRPAAKVVSDPQVTSNARFKDYQSKPVTRRAYQIQSTDVIHQIDEHTYEIRIDGDLYTFKAHETIFPGDFVVYLDESDIYHCRQAVFRERNIVD